MRLGLHAPRPTLAGLLAGLALIAVIGCSPTASSAPDASSGGSAGARRTIVVTYSVLGAVVTDLVGDGATVKVLMGNGVDPHDWSPSAREIEAVTKADLVVANGLDLEEGLAKTLDEAGKAGVRIFRATDHITVRTVGAAAPGVAAPGASSAASRATAGHGDQPAGADPHFWVDPVSMRSVVAALANELEAAGIDVRTRATDLEARLDALDAEVRGILAVVPEGNRNLVTGHESMGYFADRYGFHLVGAVIPGLTSQGEVSAGELADLKAKIQAEGVTTMFAEIGTPAAVIEAIARETGARVVELPSHNLPPDGSYFSFIRGIARTIADALR